MRYTIENYTETGEVNSELTIEDTFDLSIRIENENGDVLHYLSEKDFNKLLDVMLLIKQNNNI